MLLHEGGVLILLSINITLYRFAVIITY